MLNNTSPRGARRLLQKIRPGLKDYKAPVEGSEQGSSGLTVCRKSAWPLPPQSIDQFEDLEVVLVPIYRSQGQ